MYLFILNSDFERIHILDSFESLIWTDRYWACGDFDIAVAPTEEILSILETAEYLQLPESEHTMLLEDYDIRSDIEDGDILILKGRSLESILDRRIIWSGTAVSGNLQTGIQGLLNDSIISPTNTDREISNFEFQASTDPVITALTVDTQFVGENLYAVICDLCQSNNIGFKITLTSAENFRFALYAGVDRSYGQSTNPYVVFSPGFDNLISADYIETSRYEKTVALVAGEQGVGNTRVTVTVPATGGSKTGLARKELYFEANVTRNSPDGELTEAEYLDQLEGKGVETLAKNIYVKAFDGEVDTTMYNYGEDFNMGDILQIADSHGHETESRVTSMIYSQDADGIKMYPTFTTVE